jgi:hypothetical protein
MSFRDRNNMSKKVRNKTYCENRLTTNCTKYDCQTCDEEFCSTCTELKPAEYKVFLSYVGRWNCECCRKKERKETEKFGDEPAIGATGEQGKEELFT